MAAALGRLKTRMADMKKPVVSVLSLEGSIAAGKSKGSLSLEQCRKRVEKAFESEKLAAVLLRINSPGGSAVQSELLASHIMRKASKRSVPLISFVEDMAASGGYWLACAGKEIYVSRCSVVGSLGVIHMGLGVVSLMDKLGLESRVITSGENKDFLNPTRPLREADVEVMKRVLAEVHSHFINHVKTSRGDRLLGSDKELFNGAVWSSGDALKLGLVDGVQSMEEYIDKRWGDEVRVVRHKSKLEELAEKFGSARGAGDLTSLLQVWEQRLKMH